MDVSNVESRLDVLCQELDNLRLAIAHHQSSSTGGQTLLHLLNDIYGNVITVTNDLQSLLRDIPLTRTKRSLCSTCGEIINLLFGLSTEEHAEAVEEKLDDYKNSMTKTITIVDQQLTLIDENTNRTILNDKRIRKLQKVTIELSKYLNRIVKGNIEDTLRELQQTVKSIDILAVVVSIQEDLSKLRSAVNAAKNNDIQRSLVPDQIMSIIIKEIVIAAPKFAILNKNQIKEARRISDIRITREDSVLRIWVYTPLNELQEKVDFYQTYYLPIPTSIPGVFAQISQPTKYFAVSKSGSLYQQIEPDTFKRCKPIAKNELLCASSNSYNKKQSEVCSWLIMNELEDKKRICKIKYLRKFQPMIKKVSEGQYIYSVPEETKLDIRCPEVSQNKKILLEGMGIFQLKEKCSATGDNIYIPATFTQNHTFTINLPLKFNTTKLRKKIPDLDIFKLPEFKVEFNKTSLLQHPTDVSILKLKLREITNSQHPINKIKQNKGIIYATAIMILLVIIRLSYWIYGEKCQVAKPPKQ